LNFVIAVPSGFPVAPESDTPYPQCGRFGKQCQQEIGNKYFCVMRVLVLALLRESPIPIFMMEIISLDPATSQWLRKLAIDTGDAPAMLIASMLRLIRMDDEAANSEEASCPEVDQRVPATKLRPRPNHLRLVKSDQSPNRQPNQV
jgi:hypothetical protein